MGSASNPAPYRLLLVEDSDADARMLLEAIEETEVAVEVHRVSRGEQVAPAIARKSPSLVVLDLRLPGASGEAVLRTLRESPDTVSLPIVVLTGSPNEQDKERCQRLGANGFFVKPATPDDYATLAHELVASFLRPPGLRPLS